MGIQLLHQGKVTEFIESPFLNESYSCRNVMTGSTRIARRAGIQQPNIAAAINVADAAMSVDGSVGDIWTSSATKSLVSTNDIPIPTARPAVSGSIPSLKTSFKISGADAPTAMRTPIS